MKRTILILLLIATPAAAHPDYSLAQRKAMFERDCRLMAPEAWRGVQKRAEWLANCRREAP